MKLIEEYEFNQEGYAKLFSYKEWRIAMLNYVEHLEVEKIDYVEYHDLTDEVFVLLEGNCYMILMTFDGDNISNLEIVSLEKNKVYNIPSGTYHSHVLTKDAKLLIVEQEDTSDSNSKRKYFNSEHKKILIERFKEQYGI